jgi:hypothetical protein
MRRTAPSFGLLALLPYSLSVSTVLTLSAIWLAVFFAEPDKPLEKIRG